MRIQRGPATVTERIPHMPLGPRPGKARGTMICKSGDLPIIGAPLVPSSEREVDTEGLHFCSIPQSTQAEVFVFSGKVI